MAAWFILDNAILCKTLCTGFYRFCKKERRCPTTCVPGKNTGYRRGQKNQPLLDHLNGSFKFSLIPNSSYKVKVSYTGYLDTAFTFTSDNNAHPSHDSINIKLVKDGMRLIGALRAERDNFPIKGAW